MKFKAAETESASRRGTHGEEVGAALGLLADGRRRVGGLRDVDAQLLLAGAGRGRHRRRVVAQAAAAVARLRGRRRRRSTFRCRSERA